VNRIKEKSLVYVRRKCYLKKDSAVQEEARNELLGVDNKCFIMDRPLVHTLQ
jgi:hypothetical protein